MSEEMKYPCIKCTECTDDCVIDAIQCTGCEKWVHTKCVPMSDVLLQKWSDANLSFLCENCCFTNEEFDGVKSLKR